MITLKSKVQSLSITMLLLTTIVVTTACTSKITKIEKNVETITLQNTSVKKTPTIKSMNAVVVRKNELLLVASNPTEYNITLDRSGIFSRPIISPSKNYVSYLKNKILYITTSDLLHIKVSDKMMELSFTWQDKNNLLYSPTSGGLYAYDIKSKISKPYLQNEFNYQNITLDSKGRMYAEKYKYYKKNGYDYLDDYGVILFNPITKEENIVIKSIPNKMGTGGDLGMYPVITGISKDYMYLYIWKHPHSGSLAADGVPLSVYDTLNNKLIEYSNPSIISLAYIDNISPNPKNSRYLALIYGEGRFMGNNKALTTLDILSGKFHSLSPKEEASMTPFYKNDGKTILYASSKEQKDEPGALSNWLSSGNHHIFSIDTNTKQITKLTNNPNFFDFSPTYTDNNEIIFFRSDKNENVSIWKYDNNKETMLADGLIFYDDLNYPSQSYYGHFNTTMYTDIR